MHWEPSEHLQWFIDNVFGSQKRPKKKFRLLYEWVEDEIDETGSILATEVREYAFLLVEDGFGKYKKFQRLGERIRKFLNLRSCESEWIGSKSQMGLKSVTIF